MQLSPRECHDFNLLCTSYKAMTCPKAASAWQMTRGNPLLLWELVAHSPCSSSKAAQDLVLPQGFEGSDTGLRRKEEDKKWWMSLEIGASGMLFDKKR